MRGRTEAELGLFFFARTPLIMVVLFGEVGVGTGFFECSE